ncbi:MAG: hypothetical protein U1E28_11275 [Beijerinckiaceae bacterium]
MSKTHSMIGGLASLAVVAGAAAAASLDATSLYREKARDCRTLDLATWTHPARKVMASERVEIRKVELCSGGVYPVFTVGFPGDPMVGINDRYFNALYGRMVVANGYHPFAFVDASRGVIVYVDVSGRRSADISYDEFDPPPTK